MSETIHVNVKINFNVVMSLKGSPCLRTLSSSQKRHGPVIADSRLIFTFLTGFDTLYRESRFSHIESHSKSLLYPYEFLRYRVLSLFCSVSTSCHVKNINRNHIQQVLVSINFPHFTIITLPKHS